MTSELGYKAAQWSHLARFKSSSLTVLCMSIQILQSQKKHISLLVVTLVMIAWRKSTSTSLQYPALLAKLSRVGFDGSVKPVPECKKKRRNRMMEYALSSCNKGEMRVCWYEADNCYQSSSVCHCHCYCVCHQTTAISPAQCVTVTATVSVTRSLSITPKFYTTQLV